MKALSLLPPASLSQDYPPPGSAAEYGEGHSSNRGRRFFVFLRKYWWIPVLTLLLGIGGAVCYIMWAPPVFVSSAAMWETEKLHLSEGALFTDDAETYIGTQIELLKSSRMWRDAIERLRASGAHTVPLGKDGLPLEVTLKFREAPRSSVFAISASSADPAFSRNFLDTLMTEYLEYKKMVRKSVSGETAASISTQVESLERELKNAQDALTAFQRSNNLAILQEEGAVAGGYLTKLQTELSDLRLESKLLQASSAERDTAARGYNSNGRASVDLVKAFGAAGQTSPVHEQLTPYQEVALFKIEREKLSKYLRPKHPKIVALDTEIANAEKLVEMLRAQSYDELMASQAAVKMKMENVLASIKEWDATVVESNSRIAEAERLKLNVTRAQSVYDRLATLLQNVDITRNTDMETLAILEPASPSKQSHKADVMATVLSIILGLLAGGAIVFLIETRDDRFTSANDVNATLGDAIVGMLPEVPRKGKDSMRLLELNDPRHEVAESYRSLRSALLFLASGHRAAQSHIDHQRHTQRGKIHDRRQPRAHSGSIRLAGASGGCGFAQGAPAPLAQRAERTGTGGIAS